MIRQTYKVARSSNAQCKLFDFQNVASHAPSRTLPITKPNVYVNIDCDGGALRREESVSVLKNAKQTSYPILATQINKARYYSGGIGDKNLLIAHSTADGVYALDLTTYRVAEEKAWEKLCPIALECASEFRIDGKNVLVLAGNNYIYTYDGTTLAEKPASERPPSGIFDMCNHFGRMFVVDSQDRYKIHFSDELNPFNFKVSSREGGYINVDIAYGKINKLISMNEYLYIILERGIMRLRAYGDQDEFQLKKVDVFTGEIVASSVAKCGNIIVFASSSGINYFDGYSCKVVFDELREEMTARLNENPTFVNACYCDNCYYLSHVAGGENQALKLYLNKNKYSFISLGDYRGLAYIAREGEEIVLYSQNNTPSEPQKALAKLGDGEGMPRRSSVYGSCNIDFLKPDKLKVIERVSSAKGFRGALIIKTESERRKFDLSSRRQVTINMSGYVFDITLEIKEGKFLDFSPIVTVKVLE